MILVTGGAGFIGANFVLDWLSASDEPVLNLDKLTHSATSVDHAIVVADLEAGTIPHPLNTLRPKAAS